MIVGKQVSLPKVHSWQVYLAKEPKFFGVKEGDQINLDDYELVAKIDGEYPPFQVAQNIEDAWVDNDTTLEVYGDNQNGCRSLSVSDVVCNTISGQCYIVNNIGYHLLEAESSKSAEGDPEWMTNKDLRRRLFLKSQKEGGVPKICEVCEDSESNLHYYQEDGEQFVVCKNCLQQSMDDWKTIFGRRPNWNAEAEEKYPQFTSYLNELRGYSQLKNFTDDELLEMGIDCLALREYDHDYPPLAAESQDSNKAMKEFIAILKPYWLKELQKLKSQYNSSEDDRDYFQEQIDAVKSGKYNSRIYYDTYIREQLPDTYYNFVINIADVDNKNSPQKISDYNWDYLVNPDDVSFWDACKYDGIPTRKLKSLAAIILGTKNFEAQVDNNDRFWVDITCSWCGEPYDGTEVLDEYEGQIVHYRCAASDDYEAETFEADYVSCDNCGDSYSDANNTDLGCQCEICPNCVMEYEGSCPECARMDAETFGASSYGNYYGACLLPDGSCTETSLEMCRALGGNFQGPGTSCYADAGWARPRVMRAESSNGLGKGLTIGIVAGIISGLVTTVFGTVISEILLDRLREDPELEITDEDPGTDTP